MIQPSLFPDELPHKTVGPSERKRTLRTEMRQMLRTDGFYNFAKLAEKAFSLDGEYIMRKYGIPKGELYGMFEGVFGDACGYQETIASFLLRVKEEPNFSLNPKYETDADRKRRKRH